MAMACRECSAVDHGAMRLDVVAVVDAVDERMPRRVRGVDGLHDREAGRVDILLVPSIERQADRIEVDHGVEVSAEGEAVCDGPVTGNLDRVVEPHTG